MPSDGGIGKLKRRLAAIPVAVRRAAYAETRKAAEDIANTMRSLAPDDPATNAPDLKTSIAVTLGGQSTPPHSQPGGSHVVPENAVAITAGNSAVRYAHLVEYGTNDTEQQPYFWPGFRLGQKKAAARIKRAMRKAIKETAT